MITVTVYRSKDCAACDDVLALLESLQSKVEHQVAVVDVDQHSDLKKLLGNTFPVVEVGPYRLSHPISQQVLEVTLYAARDRQTQMQALEGSGQAKAPHVKRLSLADYLSYWLSHHYLALFNTFLLLYVGLPFLAPLALRVGLNSVARAIYTVYSPLCHQLAFRSWFLFGTQPFYPREIAHFQGYAPYETVTGLSSLDLATARSLSGAEEIGYGEGALGYKVALCQRDVAIYGSMLLFGIVYGLTGRRLKPLPWYLWVILGLLPIGIDGISQLPGLIPALSQWTIVRESNPILRTLTGALFGWTTMWYLYPIIEENMRETRAIISGKMSVVSQLQTPSGK